MIRKLFGETEEAQFQYLKNKIIILGVGIVLLLIGIIFFLLGMESVGGLIASIGEFAVICMVLVFGWAVMRALFGYTTVGALFSGNIIIGSAIFVLFIIVGSIVGFFVAFLGLCRFLKLLAIRKGNA